MASWMNTKCPDGLQVVRKLLLRGSFESNTHIQPPSVEMIGSDGCSEVGCGRGIGPMCRGARRLGTCCPLYGHLPSLFHHRSYPPLPPPHNHHINPPFHPKPFVNVLPSSFTSFPTSFTLFGVLPILSHPATHSVDVACLQYGSTSLCHFPETFRVSDSGVLRRQCRSNPGKSSSLARYRPVNRSDVKSSEDVLAGYQRSQVHRMPFPTGFECLLPTARRYRKVEW
jgi:hypothetical protein